jgi:hypothetical protein
MTLFASIVCWVVYVLLWIVVLGIGFCALAVLLYPLTWWREARAIRELDAEIRGIRRDFPKLFKD